MGFNSKYKSGKSVGKNQTVPINIDDPRLAPHKIGQTKARQGAEIDIIGLDNKSLIAGGTAVLGAGKQINPPENPVNVTPPGNNEPPKTYPGGSGPFIIVPTDPSNVNATWSGDDLVVTFNWDPSNPYNVTVSQFILELTADGVTRRTPLNTFPINKTQTSQTVTLTKSLNRSTFGLFRTKITAVCVLVADPLNNISQTVCASSVGAYVLNLPVPVINLTAISNGYSVAYTTPTSGPFDGIDVWEIESTATTAPTVIYGSDGITPTNYSRSYFNSLNPANVITQNYNKRWVMARFSSEGGVYTLFCTPQVVTPTSPVSIDNTPPNEASNISASWSGDNVIVEYKLPAQDAGTRVQIELTSPNSLVGFFYRFPDGSGRNQTTTITKKDLFDQFGDHYSSFTGILRSIDAADNRTDGVSFNVPVRTNPLATVIPTFTLTPLTNGYSVFADNYSTTPGVTYMQVYAKHTAWVGDPANDNEVVYAGANPAVVIDTDYSTVYVKIKYYDDFGNVSLYSVEHTVTPLNAAEITSFETPISFGSNGVIYAGGDYASGQRVLFKTSGIFAYDGINTSPSTQIISNASTGTPTFITTQAQIADWNVTDTKIENTLSGTPNQYTGLSASGTYSFWAGSDVTGGNSDAKFTVTPTGQVTAREIHIIGNGGTDPLISAGGLFTVNNDGSFTATSAEITGKITASSGEFTGNVKLNGGSLYALGTGGTVSSGIRTIFNSDGVAAYNSSGGYAQLLTTPLADGSVFATTAANIGGWKVDSSKIQKTSISGKGNIILDSLNGYIAVSNDSISSSLAGINSPGNDITNSVFWAGTTDPNSTANPFRVTIGGKLYSTSAEITGTVSSVGALGTITMDGTHGYFSLKTGSTGPTAYLVPRNNNIYLTSPSTTAPWSSGTQIASSGPVNGPYISAGSSYKDYWGNVTTGTGMFVGAWDYFTTGSSKPFITATDTGIQLSVSPDLGLLLDRGDLTLTGNKLNPAIASGTPSMLFYTAKQSGAPYSPTTAYGAWAAFTNNKIKLTAASTVFINVDGTTGDQKIEIKSNDNIWQKFTSTAIKLNVATDIWQQFDSTGIQLSSTASIWQKFSSTGIKLQSTATNYQEFTSSGIRIQSTDSVYQTFDSSAITLTSGNTSNAISDMSAYGGASKIVINSSKVSITGIPRAGTFNMDDWRGSTYYLGAYPLGYPPRQRMVIEDPVTGEAQLGLGIYYLDTTKINGTGPYSSMGVQGDIALVF